MAALSAVNMLASPPANGRVSPASPESESARFEQMYSRELNRPAESARERPQASSAEAEPAEEAPTQVMVADQAVVDPLLASLQLLLNQQMAPLENAVPAVPEDVMEDASGLEKNPLLAGLWSGDAVVGNGRQSVDSTQPEPVSQPLVAGKNLPSPADAAANSASALIQLDAQLAEAMSEGEFDQSLQASLQVQPGQARTQGVAASTQQAPVHARHVVAEPVGEGRWGEVVAQRVSMMLGRQEQRLEMQLNPPNLGPMEVRLSLGAEQASIVFTSQHAAVREALAAATPRLTALLADQGIVLTDVQVASDSLNQQQFQQAYQQQDAQKQRGAASMVQEEGVHEPVMLDLGSIRVPVARSGVSLYV